MIYRIEFKRSALKDLLKLPPEEVRRIIERIDQLALDPRPLGVIKLKGTHLNLWRLRVGNYRIVYSIHDEILLVEIIDVGDRKEIYR